MPLDSTADRLKTEYINFDRRLAKIPEELLRCRQWVAWRYGPLRENGKQAKEPINPRTVELAKANDPATWGTYTEAVACDADGIGFVFSKDDPYVGVDLDGCIADGEIGPWALNIVEKLGSYAEISPSGTGIKAIVRGSLPTDKTGVKRGPIELYQHGRFFALTGEELEPGKNIAEAQETLEKLHRRVEAAKTQTSTTQSHTAATAGFSGEDERLIEKAARKQVFRALFYSGDTSGFSSHSEADLALCGALAFWTGKDPERMDRLFRESALYREKWERADYRRGTIETAISRCRNVYSEGAKTRESGETIRKRFTAEREAVERHSFEWRGGDTDYKLTHALIDTGGVSGSVSGDYPTVAMAEREIQLKAAIGSNNTVRRSLERLIERGLIELHHTGGSHTGATYRLLFSEVSPSPGVSPRVQHSGDTPPCVHYGAGSVTVRTNVTRMRGQYTPPRQSHDKNGQPIPVYRGGSEKRMSPRSGQVYRHVVASGSASLREIADQLGIKDRRYRHKLIQPGGALEQAVSFGLLEEYDHRVYRPASGHEQRFEQYLEDSGCNESERRQRDRIERERLAWELHGTEERIAHELEQAGYDPEESEPVPDEPEPVPEEPHSGATQADAEPTVLMYPVPHRAACLCLLCVPIFAEPRYAKPRALPTDSPREMNL